MGFSLKVAIQSRLSFYLFDHMIFWRTKIAISCNLMQFHAVNVHPACWLTQILNTELTEGIRSPTGNITRFFLILIKSQKSCRQINTLIWDWFQFLELESRRVRKWRTPKTWKLSWPIQNLSRLRYQHSYSLWGLSKEKKGDSVKAPFLVNDLPVQKWGKTTSSPPSTSSYINSGSTWKALHSCVYINRLSG